MKARGRRSAGSNKFIQYIPEIFAYFVFDDVKSLRRNVCILFRVTRGIPCKVVFSSVVFPFVLKGLPVLSAVRHFLPFRGDEKQGKEHWFL